MVLNMLSWDQRLASKSILKLDTSSANFANLEKIGVPWGTPKFLLNVMKFYRCYYGTM